MKQEPRRSMSEALRTGDLPAQAFALIKEGAPKSQGETRTLALSPPRVNTAPTESLAETGDDGQTITEGDAPRVATAVRAAKTRPARETEPEPVAATVSASMTVRLPAEIPTRLLRAATDRKIGKLRPCTQQDIVAEALAQWLKKNGY